MKIGIIIGNCRNSDSSRRVLELSNYLVEGNEVHLFCNNYELENEKVIFHKIPAFSGNFFIRETSFSILSTLLLKKFSFDITFATPSRYLSPKVIDLQFIYGYWRDYKIKNNLPLSLEDYICSLIEKYNIRKAKKIIAISKSAKRDIQKKYNISEEKVKVVYNGVNLDEFTPKNKIRYKDEINSIKKNFGIRKDELIFLFIGNYFQRKGLRYVITALSELKFPSYKLIVVGEDNFRPYQELASKRRVKNKILFLKKSQKIAKFFALADIFLLPTLYEPFGLVILEAMASGLPVITSKSAGVSELIENGKEGLLLKDPKNPYEIVDKIKKLIKSDTLRGEIAKNARKKAEKYSWEITAKGILDVFESIAKS
jgi:UDP-glucose:(heptosyl)LPS alpha-1,3-glucosyltransferase